MERRCQVHVGRLVEIRQSTPSKTVADVDQFFVELEQELRTKIGYGQLCVIAADWRQWPLMSSEAAERRRRHMIELNSRVLRSAILVSKHSSTLELQALRLVRDSRHPHRRLYSDADQFVLWLSEVLRPDEIARLRAFVAEGEASAAMSSR
jgi:hypothetical protein